MYNGYNYGGYNGWQNPSYTAAPPASVPPQYSNRYQAPPQYDAPSTQRPSLQVPWVNGEVGAQAYLIAPNSTVLLMDSDNPIFYIKTSDASGKAMIQAFKYEELKPNTAPQSAPAAYVTRQEFEEFKSSLLNKGEETKI